jgi:hypothetical protein
MSTTTSSATAFVIRGRITRWTFTVVLAVPHLFVVLLVILILLFAGIFLGIVRLFAMVMMIGTWTRRWGWTAVGKASSTEEATGHAPRVEGIGEASIVVFFLSVVASGLVVASRVREWLGPALLLKAGDEVPEGS